jgi:hypothetical protein
VTREHSPRPGAGWETRLVRNEVVVTDPGGPQPADTRPNRAARRAAARDQRKARR